MQNLWWREDPQNRAYRECGSEASSGACRVVIVGDLVYHLRNAVAHGHVRFSSDDRDPAQVAIEVEDYKPNAQAPYWCARITADDLRAFCFRFIDLLENTIG